MFQIWNDYCEKCELFLPMFKIAIKNVHKLETKVGNLQTLISWTAKYVYGFTKGIYILWLNRKYCFWRRYYANLLLGSVLELRKKPLEIKRVSLGKMATSFICLWKSLNNHANAIEKLLNHLNSSWRASIYLSLS